MPIALQNHAAAVFGKHTILISGGIDAKVNENFLDFRSTKMLVEYIN